METVLGKEKAEKCANKTLRSVAEWIAYHDGYAQGYTEAMLWRDPEVEKPENEKPVIVKYVTQRGIKKYGIAKYFELGIGNPWIIEGSTGREVIGWRPIE